ncbi:hypothetical protein ADUPG1_010038 [Aduncisulcus paluster]|uniref:Uncharacterized protein n=1 Tax=Aduncisulcus paluster TaxID=2918883 RepID=A0ABQ5KXM9_9EUKA|nr:hypothetical protein ADUPG1_010038 [Aduncisulcus paluster]|eukprot:gnl/Carplike_NY0171/2895_a3891_519.p1 GENE.gnl/Carplike_NY0171/2895_a3891_519~~gnl/Carplike_NY0171/2895_a3891_519.p1  ORF type:complete len:171 (-),score=23.59 gnl/Carplike_NY0171/2895_a3891_519:195-707(-)
MPESSNPQTNGKKSSKNPPQSYVDHVSSKQKSGKRRKYAEKFSDHFSQGKKHCNEDDISMPPQMCFPPPPPFSGPPSHHFHPHHPYSRKISPKGALFRFMHHFPLDISDNELKQIALAVYFFTFVEEGKKGKDSLIESVKKLLMVENQLQTMKSALHELKDMLWPEEPPK